MTSIAGNSHDSPRGRILLLTHHYPPTETPGALRWGKLSRFLVEHGYGVDVVSAGGPEGDQSDQGIKADLDHRTVRVAEHPVLTERIEGWLWRWFGRSRHSPISTAFQEARKKSRLARPESLAAEEMHWLGTPRDLLRHWWTWQAWQHEAAWASSAARAGERLLTAHHVGVISCGPPHYIHLVGSRLALRRGLPFVMDLRDPWSLPRRLPEHVASPLAFWLAGRAERKAVDGAGLIIANTESLSRALRLQYPTQQDQVLTVMNGYDEDDPIPIQSDRSGPFRIVYAGSVYLDRSPRVFFEALRSVIETQDLSPKELQVDFLGPGEAGGTSVLSEATSASMADYVRVLPRVPRAEALATLSSATMLLNLPQDSQYAVPSKVFEYLRFNAWILALANPGTPTHTVLRDTNVDCVPNDQAAIADVLQRRITMYRVGSRPGPTSGREALSRTAQARVLIDRLDRVLGSPRQPRSARVSS